mmetsp:Transcript_126922/g.329294  ORF Transcript_126922/g.329294 Transcript_126922/m.329294 type:complete len:996 (-) Transcript_126922:146-3133(-)
MVTRRIGFALLSALPWSQLLFMFVLPAQLGQMARAAVPSLLPDMPCLRSRRQTCEIGPSQADVEAFAAQLTSQRSAWSGPWRFHGDIEDLLPLSTSNWSGTVEGLEVSHTTRLVSLHGLEGIKSLGNGSSDGTSIWVEDNDALKSLVGLIGVQAASGSLYLKSNNKLSSLRDLQGIKSLGRDSDGTSIWIEGNDALTSLDGLKGLRGPLRGALRVRANAKLMSLKGLRGITSLGRDTEGYSIYIHRNGALQSLNGLEGLQGNLSGSLNIMHNPKLTSIDSLKGITSLGLDECSTSISIDDNVGLESIKGLAGLKGDLPGGLEIKRNSRLESLHGLEGIKSLGWDTMCRSMTISGNAALKSLEGLVTQTLSGSIYIQNNAQLTSLRGLENIETLPIVSSDGGGASLSIQGNPKLQSLEAISKIRFQGESDSLAMQNTLEASVQGLKCPGGMYAREGGLTCESCDGRVSAASSAITSNGSADSICHACSWWQKPADDWTECHAEWPVVICLIVSSCSLAYGCVLLGTNFQLSKSFSAHWQLSGRSILVSNISLENGSGLVLTTWGRHGFKQRWRQSFPILLKGTGCRFLTTTEELCLRARVLGEDRLVLLDANGQALEGNLCASMGAVALPATKTLIHTGRCMPLFVSTPLLIFAGLAGLIEAVVFAQREVLAAATCVGLALAASVLIVMFQEWTVPPTPLRRHLDLYGRKLQESNPHPASCERGAMRALRLGQILDLYHFFQSFVQRRNMYFLEPTVIRPLTAPYQLSYAEVAGPSPVEWFVSHFWGHPFAETCTALEKHARRTAVGTRSWRDTAYWVCTFSNSQYAVEEELGNSQWNRSSFYIALRSDGCKGVCMVLDENVHPLGRAWCLFELVQAMLREEQEKHQHNMGRDGFWGVQFCTSSGILNRGEASSEISLNIGKRLATLRLEDAKASCLADKQMIHALVDTDMGGFEKVNGQLRAQFASALSASQEAVFHDFEVIRSSLEGGRASPVH